MKLPLSKRLQVCCSLVKPGQRVADIGCDHGYLGIHLLQSGIATFVIASDINEQPLNSALRNARKFGVADKMAFYISDGVRNIPRDFDTMVCAGMGADTMISILEAATWLRDSRYTLVLQCQSKIPTLRSYLSDHGFHIRQEIALRDGRFLYTVMEVCYEPCQPLQPGETYFSPALLQSQDPLALEYYKSTVFRLQRAVDNQKAKDPTMQLALEQLKNMHPFLKGGSL